VVPQVAAMVGPGAAGTALHFQGLAELRAMSFSRNTGVSRPDAAQGRALRAGRHRFFHSGTPSMVAIPGKLWSSSLTGREPRGRRTVPTVCLH